MFRPSVVVTAIIVYNKKFLIAKRTPHVDIHPGLWVFPGGKLEEGEDLVTCLERELLEEVGITITKKIQFISSYSYQRPDKTWTLGLSFLVHTTSDQVSLDQKEFSDYKWITVLELKNYPHILEMEEEINLAFA